MAKKPRKRRSGRKWQVWVPVIGCAAIAALAVYTAYLDHEVRARFEGARWSLPAKVYASPVQLYAGEDLNSVKLVHILKHQGYRRSAQLSGAGSYRVGGGHVDLRSRPFTFWDGHQQAKQVRVRFSGGRIQSMQSLVEGQQDPALLRLDPLLIGSIYPAHRGADRILVRLDDVPPMLPSGLIMVEDQHFLEHHGVSPKAILRAAVADLRAGRLVQGGSTITQQLVKNLYLSDRRTLTRKAREALMAILLDAHYSKEAILEAYLNEVYLGQEGNRAIHGFGLASYFYFAKPVQELRPSEIALLVGMVKGPNYYNPRRHPKRALARRNLVLDIFEKSGLLSSEDATTARGQPLGVTAGAVHGVTQYPAFIDMVRQQLHGHYRDQDLTTEGLRIFTTLDPRVQAAMEKRVTSGVKTLERSRHLKSDSLESAAVVTSVEGGRVLGLVGGTDVRYAGFNRALEARRQVGSLMKPMVYLTALDDPAKYNVLTPLDDSALAVDLPNGDIWRPRNYERRSHGTGVPLYQALEHSYNQATARLAINLGLPQVVTTLKALGYDGNPEAVPSLALGAVDMSPVQVAQIYNTLADGGYYTPLRSIRAVTTRDGKPLNRYPLKIRRAFDEQSVYLVDWILQGVTHQGTGRSAYNILPGSLQVAGKTGTSNELRDSWFAGFSGNRVAVVWVGRDDNKPGEFTGATGALHLWSHIMADIDNRSFAPPKPDGITAVPLVLPASTEDSAATVRPASLGARDCNAAVQVPFTTGYVPPDLTPCGTATLDQSGQGKRKSNWLFDLFK